MDDLVLGPKLAALSCGKPVYLVILLPGDGLSAEAFSEIAMGWAPEMIKADFQTLVPPLDGQWFGSTAQCAEAAQKLENFLDAEILRTRLPASHLALVGFGQGAELALAVGLRRAEPLGCLIGFSGAYDAAIETAHEKSPPLLLVHGEADELAPFAAMVALKDALKAKGAPAWSFKRPGLGHALDGDGVDAAGGFLAKHLKHKAAGEAH